MKNKSYAWRYVWKVAPYGSTAPMFAVWEIGSSDRLSPWFDLRQEAIAYANNEWRKKIDKEFEDQILGGKGEN